MDLTQFGLIVMTQVKEFVQPILTELSKKIDKGLDRLRADVDKRFSDLPKPEQGEKGIQGDAGERGEKGEKGDAGPDGAMGEKGEKGDPGERGGQGESGERGEPGTQGERGEAGAAGIGERGPQGEKGLDGAPGAAGEAGAVGATGERGEAGAAGEPGAAGARGEKGDAGDRGEAGAPGAAGERGEKGLDGEPGAPGTKGDPGEAGLKGEKGLSGDPGRDGRDGKDAIEMFANGLVTLKEERTYKAGTAAKWRGGIVRAFRDTDPLNEEHELEKAGWEILVAGFEGFEFLQDENDPRKFSFTLRATAKDHRKDFRLPLPMYVNVFKDGDKYERGDMVTFNGSVWHCNKDSTAARPNSGSADWTLSVKRGQKGKDLIGVPGTVRPKDEPVKLR